MTTQMADNERKTLLSLMVLYGVASLVHFIHNAVYLKDYPSVPSWLTATGIYAAWIVITAIGVVGYGYCRRGSRKIGLALITLYALFGFGGFDHYLVAPIAAHTTTANVTIAIEAAAAAALLVFIVVRVRSQTRSTS
jgi:hypothetical protein